MGTELGKYTKDNGGTWGDFLRTAWDEEIIQKHFLKDYEPGDTVYDKVNEYVKEQAFKVKEYVKEGGGRKKRRKRRKTKRKKSKRKKSKKK